MIGMKTTIEHIVPDTDGRLIAVSDIHGCVRYLEGLLKKLSFTRRDTLVIVGDSIEKGPESLETVRFILSLKADGYQVHPVMGNVDRSRIEPLMEDGPEAGAHLLGALRWTKRVWEKGLLLDMLAELGIALDEVKEENIGTVRERFLHHFKKEITFLWNQPAILTAGNFIFVHGGIPTDDLDLLRGTDAGEYLKTDAFLRQEHCFEKYVVVGHWPVCLYRADEVNLNPVYDEKKHVIAIDGGCGLKTGAQLNALVLPGGALSMEGAEFETFDDYPVIVARGPQKPREHTIRIQFTDMRVEELGFVQEDGVGRDFAGALGTGSEQEDGVGRDLAGALGTGSGQEDGASQDFADGYGKEAAQVNGIPQERLVRLRHVSSGKMFLAPESYVYHRNGKTYCDDYSDACLEISAGDRLSVINATSRGYVVKKKGVIGWYEKDHFYGAQ